VSEIITKLLTQVPQLIDVRKADYTGFMTPSLAGSVESIVTFLTHEIMKFNRLIGEIRSSMDNLSKAIEGINVMSPELEEMYFSVLNNMVPENWYKVRYLSLKPLATYVLDLNERVNFILEWLGNGAPEAYWLGCFFFPQSFLTAIQ
jgi:dynein heavy chain